MKKRLAIAAIAVPFAMLAAFTLSSNAQEKNKPELAKEAPLAPGFYREFSGIIQLGNYDELPQKKDPQRFTVDINGEHGMESMEDYFKAPVAPHIMGGSVYFSVFRNVGNRGGDTFGTGMPGGLDQLFVPGEGDFRPGSGTRAVQSSPRLDTSAKYLFLFQIVASRGLDARNQMTDVQKDLVSNAIRLILGEENNNKIKLAIGEDKVKLLKQQQGAVQSLATAANKAMLPDAAIEDVHRFSVQLNVDPRHITSWGYFDGAGFAVHIAKTDEYTDRWGHHHKTVANGGVIPNDMVEDRIQAVSFLPGVNEMVKDMDFERIKKRAYAMGVMEGSFHVNDANVGIEKSLPYRFAQGMVDRGADIKFASHLQAGKKKADFAVKPQRVRIVVDDTRFNDLNPEFVDDDYTTTAFVVDFDQYGVKKRGNDGELRGIPRTKHSMVFGFTTNLEPVQNRRIRLDDLESTDRNKDLPFNEFFSEKIADKVPARNGYSRGFDYWNKGKKMAGFDRNREYVFAGNNFGSMIASDSGDPLAFVLLQGGGGGGAGAGALSMSGLGVSPPSGGGGGGGISGGFSSAGSQPSGGGGGGATPGWGAPFSGSGGGFGGGGGLTGGGTNQNQTPPNQQGTQAGEQIVNFKATLINQQQQQQQQGQFQNQHQGQHQHDHDHGHGHHGNVVPAPASLLLALLGLPGLWLLRRRKTGDATTENPSAA